MVHAAWRHTTHGDTLHMETHYTWRHTTHGDTLQTHYTTCRALHIQYVSTLYRCTWFQTPHLILHTTAYFPFSHPPFFKHACVRACIHAYIHTHTHMRGCVCDTNTTSCVGVYVKSTGGVGVYNLWLKSLLWDILLFGCRYWNTYGNAYGLCMNVLLYECIVWMYCFWLEGTYFRQTSVIRGGGHVLRSVQTCDYWPH